MPEANSKPVVEKIPHTYTLTGKKLAEMCKFEGVVTSINASPYSYEDKEDGNATKTAYKITVQTMERKEQA